MRHDGPNRFGESVTSFRWKLFVGGLLLIAVGAGVSVLAARVGGAPADTGYTPTELIGASMIVVGSGLAAAIVIVGFITNLVLLWRQFSRRP